MNNLSLLLYAADVLPQLAAVATILAVIFTAVVFIVTIISWSMDPREMSDGFRHDHQTIKRSFVYLAAVGYFTATVIPEPTTFYLIAASEGAQLALANPEAQEMFGSVKDIIQLKLDQVVAELKAPVTK